MDLETELVAKGLISEEQLERLEELRAKINNTR